MKRFVMYCGLMVGLVGTGSIYADTAATAPAATQDAITAAAAAQTAEVQITMDTSETPELKEWADKLQPVLVEWYPKVSAMLASEGYEPPKKFTVTFKDMDGVA